LRRTLGSPARFEMRTFRPFNNCSRWGSGATWAATDAALEHRASEREITKKPDFIALNVGNRVFITYLKELSGDERPAVRATVKRIESGRKKVGEETKQFRDSQPPASTVWPFAASKLRFKQGLQVARACFTRQAKMSIMRFGSRK
jgi:hypothetical protein